MGRDDNDDDDDNIVEKFLKSKQGRKAHEALTEKDIDSDEADNYLSHAAKEGANHTHDEAQRAGVLGEHPGRNFFAAYAAGFVRGDGVFGALGSGAEGVLVGRITDALCNKAGIDNDLATTVAATSAPFVLSYLREYLGF